MTNNTINPKETTEVEPTRLTKFCSDCGKKIDAKAEICPNCGVRQKSVLNTTASQAEDALSKRTPNGKNKFIAAIIAFLLGGIGAHKFYLGKVGMGILYLLFCWTGIPFLVGLVEGVLLLVMSDQDFERKYG